MLSKKFNLSASDAKLTLELVLPGLFALLGYEWGYQKHPIEKKARIAAKESNIKILELVERIGF